MLGRISRAALRPESLGVLDRRLGVTRECLIKARISRLIGSPGGDIANCRRRLVAIDFCTVSLANLRCSLLRPACIEHTVTSLGSTLMKLSRRLVKFRVEKLRTILWFSARWQQGALLDGSLSQTCAEMSAGCWLFYECGYDKTGSCSSRMAKKRVR